MTGGGFFENIPRILADDLRADITLGSWNVPAIFNYMMEKGQIELEEMFGTFNMGVGYIAVVSPEDVAQTLSILEAHGETATVIGKIVSGDKGVVLCNA
jgi:phosphoribosylformylglycinamidine cyclo-ligase